MMTCDATTQYCYELQSGPVMFDGGGFTQATCLPLPTACTATPTCSCVQMNAPGCHGPGAMESCTTSSNGGVTLKCSIGV